MPNELLIELNLLRGIITVGCYKKGEFMKIRRFLSFFVIITSIVNLTFCSDVKELPRDRGYSGKDAVELSDAMDSEYIPDDTGDVSEIADSDFEDSSDVVIIRDTYADYGAVDTGGGNDTGYTDAGPCPLSLAERLTVKRLSIAPDSVNNMGGMYFSYYTPPIIRAYKDGYLLAYLSYNGKIRVLGLNRDFSLNGTDVSIDGNELRGLAVSAGDFAVLVQRGTDEMAILGYGFDGVQKFDTTIIGKTDHNVTWAKYIKREWGDYGTLGYYNNQYVAYFGHSMNWGESGEHQGDLLWFFDSEGRQNGGLWDWGCSHSLDVRLAFNSQKLGAVCLSDCYPQKAICFNHRESVIHNEPSGNCAGRSNAVLGGFVAFEDGFYLTFISSEGRQSSDVALAAISNSGVVSGPVWITDTPEVQEDDTHLAVYGENLFVVYRAGGEVKAGIITKSGDIVKGFENFGQVDFNQQTFIETGFGGNPVWVFGNGSELSIYMVRYCN